METFTRTKPSDEKFTGNSSLKTLDKRLHAAQCINEVLDANLLKPNEGNFTGKLECVSLVMELAMHCTAKSPKERIGMKDALAALEKIKVQF